MERLDFFVNGDRKHTYGILRGHFKSAATLVLTFVAVMISGCAPMRQPVPAGTIPAAKPLSMEDEQYGHAALSQLTETYPLELDDSKVERARRLVEKLTVAAGADRDPWHVYVLQGPKVQNAAATRGNYIFVWSGMLDALGDDNVLSVVLAHEIAHVLADHARLSPNEQVNSTLTQVAGAVAQTSVLARGNVAIVADLAAMLTQQTMNALLINPETQRKELEADIIGLHLMAEAGIDPRIALQFWERNLNDPNYRSGLPQFLSSHPSSNERLQSIRHNLDSAILRYEDRRQGRTASSRTINNTTNYTANSMANNTMNNSTTSNSNFSRGGSGSSSSNTIRTLQQNSIMERWITAESNVAIHTEPSSRSNIVQNLARGEQVDVVGRSGRWLIVDRPKKGYVWGPMLAPAR